MIKLTKVDFLNKTIYRNVIETFVHNKGEAVVTVSFDFHLFELFSFFVHSLKFTILCIHISVFNLQSIFTGDNIFN